jgi:prepilin-type N-terminal cleavage/methylation domain-containing protein
MRRGFTLIEILSATLIIGIIMAISMQSINYINHIHQQNEIRYLALNRADSEMARLVTAYENFVDFTDSDSDGRYNGNNATQIGGYGLRISTGSGKENFVQLKNAILGNVNMVDNGDFIALLEWNATVDNNESNISLNITYPYIYRDDTNFPQLWDYTETITINTSTKVKP